MKACLAVVLAMALGGIAWGRLVGAHEVPPRHPAPAGSVESAWYQALPADPGAATDAFLKRVSPAARAQGDALSATRYVVLPLRIAVLLGAIALFMVTGAAVRTRALLQRVTSIVPLQDALAASVLLLALFLINIPVDTYAGFVRLHEAGLSTQPYVGWFVDSAIGWGAITLFQVVGIVLLLALIRRRPQSWVGWMTLVYGVLAAVYLLVAPVFLEPLLNRITPLADGPRKAAILSLARANGVPANDVYVQDASRQSTLLNAHVSGLGGTVRIVLDDNTIERTAEPVVTMIMAHEIGHYVLAHGEKSIVFNTLVVGLGLVLIGWASRRLISLWGPRWDVRDLGEIGALPIFWGLFLLWGYLSLPITNGITRQQEAEADLFALNAAREPLAWAEFAIGNAEVQRLDPAPLVSWIYDDHPSARQRIDAAMRWRAEHLFEGASPR